MATIHAQNVHQVPGILGLYDKGSDITPVQYSGGAYDPDDDRIIMAPMGLANHAGGTWHYIDCRTDTIVEYSHGDALGDISATAYNGAVYCPTQRRVYFMPWFQGQKADLHFWDCTSKEIKTYTKLASMITACGGGVYSPTQDRIYIIPGNQSGQPNWHYIDCTDHTDQNTAVMVQYAHGVSAPTGGYIGGCYDATNNRIYMAPDESSGEATWHYIDCSDGSVVPYTHGKTDLVDDGYQGAVYDPYNDRIYFVPFNQAREDFWHYVDCATGDIVSYANNMSGNDDPYMGGAYSPTDNCIYFTPTVAATNATWTYINCYDGSVGSIFVPAGYVSASTAYQGSVYSPLNNCVYHIPYSNLSKRLLHKMVSKGVSDHSRAIAIHLSFSNSI